MRDPSPLMLGFVVGDWGVDDGLQSGGPRLVGKRRSDGKR